MRDGDPNYNALDKYYPDMCKTAIEFLAKGKSYAALAGQLEIAEQTVYAWQKKYPDFDRACQVGKAKGQAYWEQVSDDNMYNKEFCSTRYIFKMKSQYKLKDGSEPIKQDAPTTPAVIFGMEGKEHGELVERILQGSIDRKETN
jgi:Helix-turn-helix domain